ncbi:hypothetical protein [Burkholderia multivorans]|uniref:hypothetical protein n=1 Tax=Burkholderia multivorans TaxID=87883 RepID=UPI001B9A81FD|nr:hypothetical protein [Burkholderia multivorans]MBR7896903.1 hypothetical protein [Burkholderia multivorans]
MFDQSGRVSSPIVAFNAVILQGTTQTGRIYELVGKPGVALQADYVWKKWCELYEVTSYTDVCQQQLRSDPLGPLCSTLDLTHLGHQVDAQHVA